MWKHKKYKKKFESYYGRHVTGFGARYLIIYGETTRGARRRFTFTSHQAAKKAGWKKVG